MALGLDARTLSALLATFDVGRDVYGSSFGGINSRQVTEYLTAGGDAVAGAGLGAGRGDRGEEVRPRRIGIGEVDAVGDPVRPIRQAVITRWGAEEIGTLRLWISHQLGEPKALARVGLLHLRAHLSERVERPHVGGEGALFAVHNGDCGMVNVLPAAS